VSESSLRGPTGGLAGDDQEALTAGWAVQPRRRAGVSAKRAFDLVAATIILLLALPLLLVAGLAVRLSTPGPGLFRQTRLGRDRRPFELFKFRTMYTGSPDTAHREYVSALLTADEPPPGAPSGLYKLQGDARITPVGRLLRRTSIDELPQLINVLRGEMSLVGPRPTLAWEADLIGPAHSQRFQVAPGLTGLWQVSGRNWLTMRQGFDLDVEYVRRHSFGLDLWILLKTVPAVLSARGSA
jgi:lipopolysaccharide/colanic/teichoic acid biosynthesis glycosyltransferase